MAVSWRGVFPAACTQFHADYSLNIPGTLKHLDAMLAAGVHGFVMMGSVGENTTLEPAEKRELLKATVEARRQAGAGAGRGGRVHDGAGVPVGGGRRRSSGPTG